MAKKSTKKPAEDTVKLDTGRMEQVPFGQLAVSPLNVRKNAEVSADDELTASIRAHGLLQPLVGYIATKGKATVLVAAGQRRFLALQHIAQPDTPIPVRIVDEATAIEVSLAENLERKDMNPADEFAAFQALIDTGTYDANRIASRFGFPIRHVRRRLKMAALLPEILDAVREGKITIEAAEAYAAGSEDVQSEIFKKHSAKNAWKPHEPATIRQDIVLSGISASSRVAKFIGGLETYKAAGGTTIDEDFLDLFGKDADDSRLRDIAIVRELIDAKKAELQKDAEKLVLAKYPFVTGVEWMDLLGTSYGSTAPKPPKKSGLIVVERGWNTDADEFAKMAAAAATEHGGAVIGLIDIDAAGEIEPVVGKFLVGKDAWAKVRPKEQDSPAHRRETDEERAEREREHAIREQMEKMYGRSLIGESPGFGVMRVNYDRYHGHMLVTLIRLEPKGDDLDFSDEWNPRIKTELLEPFREPAIAKVAEIEANRKAKEEADAAAAGDFEAALADLEKKPIAEWPAVAVVTVDMDGDKTPLFITRIEHEGEPALNLVDSIERPSIAHDPGFTVEVIRDQACGYVAEIATYDTVEAVAEAHAGQCRMCGCTEVCACEESEDGKWSGPCTWADAGRTLCSNPDCLAKAGVAAEEQLEAAE